MKPYGRKPAPRFPGKVDLHLHPKRKLKMWWEDEMSDNTLTRSGVKRLIKKEIDEQLNEQEDDRRRSKKRGS